MIDLNKYIGRKYCLGARGPDYFDCWGLVIAVFKEMNIHLPDWVASNSDPLSIARLMRHGIDNSLLNNYAISVDAPKNFDIAFLLRGERAHHCGVYVHGGILHIFDNNSGSVFEKADNFVKTGRGFLSFYRWLNG